jgi:signal transduction histidine kinase
MGFMKKALTWMPASLEGRMIAVLAFSLLALFAGVVLLEVRAHESAIEAAQSAGTLERIRKLYPVLERIGRQQIPDFLGIASSCHAGHTVTDQPFKLDRSSAEGTQLEARLARELSVDPRRLSVGHASLTRADFSYAKCRASEIDLPFEGIVISLRLRSGQWLNTEVHPHEWHFREKLGWMMQVSAIFLLVGGVAIFFMHRLSQPLNELTQAARRFGEGLNVSTLEEDGPADLRRAIQAFNAMQRQVTEEVERRTNTLAAISHDVRTPLTALRIKAELIDDARIRQDVISSVERMERITASALEFLRGQSRSEPMRKIDLSALLESECLEFEETGRNVSFSGAHGVQHVCRPDALARAVRNLIDNAVKHGGDASVTLHVSDADVEISVADEGPGIPPHLVAQALEPFGRLSRARENQEGGFGLGLAIALAVARGHEGELILRANEPTGLVAILRLPIP